MMGGVNVRVVGDAGLTLTQAANMVGVAPSTAFYHYRILMNAGLVKRKGRRRGARYTWPEHTWALVRQDRLKGGPPREKSNGLNLEPV